MTVFVLQNNSFDRIGRLIVPCLEYCSRHGHEFVDRSLTEDLDVDAIELDESAGLLVYGSVGWAKRFKASRFGGWIDYDEDAFAASNWGPILGERAFNGGGMVMSALEVSARLALGGRFHLRPDKEDKAFAGGVFDAVSWASTIKEREGLLGKKLDDLPCWLSETKAIDAEIRCWFVDGALVEASFYRQDDAMLIERVTDPGMMRLAADLGCLYLPCGTVVLDIALQGDDAAVLEYNPIHSSGWYAADVDRVLGAWVEQLGRKAAPISRGGISPSTV
jgi:hypothetical protein